MSRLDFDFLGRLRAGLLVPLKEFEQLDLEPLRPPKLRAQVKRLDGADNEIPSAEQAVATIPIFLTSMNLETPSRWIPTHASAKRTAVQEWIGSRPFKELLQGWQP